MKFKITVAIGAIFFSLSAGASSVKVSTLDNSLEQINTVDLNLAQEKTDHRGAWEGELSVGKTKTVATPTSPETVTLDLLESIDYNTIRDWVFGLDAKQDHEDDGLNVVESGLYAQKKIYYTKPLRKKKKAKGDDDDDTFYPSLTIKVRLASGSTSEGGKVKLTSKGASYPVLLGFKEKNEGLSFTWDFLKNWSAGLQFTQYQYDGFDKTQAYLYAHPGLAERFSGASSSVTSVVDHEEAMNVQWFFTDEWDVNVTETLQTDYVTGDVGSTSQIDFTWDFTADWSVIVTLMHQRITPSPGDPPTIPATPAQNVDGGGLAIAYDW